ncbi:hypothetical protein A6A04_14820 [Paramagnetospirillum marisnigri]|uniref:Uncharacterized protein n=1 Tax=Paramagnetospirillum marisnigri TaxID=1285242 RepID=A0A178MV91_9PROT|nr:hypothetical protein A6A04_14820 [Paramagnetospirillum marisnigri]
MLYAGLPELADETVVVPAELIVTVAACALATAVSSARAETEPASAKRFDTDMPIPRFRSFNRRAAAP